MAIQVLMPKLGLTMTEGTVEEWKCKEGATVKKGDVIFTVATDKLTNDVECEHDGVLIKVVVGEGQTVPCKAVVAYIGEAGEEVSGVEDMSPVTEGEPQATSAPKVTEKNEPVSRGGNIVASPAAKKLAKEKNIDLSLIAGTGPKGRITIEDVEKYIESPQNATPKMSPVAEKMAVEMGIDAKTIQADGRIMKKDVMEAAGMLSSADDDTGNDSEPVKVNSLRRSIAANMLNSWHTSPRVTYTRAIDCTAFIDMYKRLAPKMLENEIKLSYNHIFMKAAAKALTEFPDVNASFSDDMLTRHKHVNMGLAVAKGDGLIVPNVKQCDVKTLSEIAAETTQLIHNVRNGNINMEDITGGTFTITSLGPFGVNSFSPIINQPELAILGVANIVDTPVVRDGEIVIRPMMNLCLTADHRVVDGVMGSRFLGRICEILEDPYLLLI